MSKVPEGWAQTNLGEVIFFNYGKSLAAAKRKSGNIDVYGSNGVVGQHNEAITQSPAIIVGRKGSFGEVHFSQTQCFPIDTTYFVDEFPATEPKFAFGLLKHLPLKEMNRATAIPGLNREDAHNLPIQLPPLAEQQRIVRKLDSLSAHTTIARNHLNAIAKLVERMRGAILSTALNGTLVNSQIDSGENTKLGEFIIGIEQGWSPKCENVSVTDPEEWAVLTTTAIQPIKFDSTENKKLPSHLEARPHLEVEVGDVLMTRAGPRVRCAVCCYVAETTPRRIFSDKVYRIRLKASVDPEFFVMMMNSPEMVKALDDIKSGGSESGLNLTQGRLKALSINLWDISIQRDIVDEIKKQIDKIDDLIAESEKALKLTDRLDQRILAKAFAGELVPQDPNDEPASELLERIREARANTPKKPRKKPTKAKSMKVAPQERLLTDSAKWPEQGLPFEDIAKRLTLPHDDLKDAVFALLEGDAPKLRQEFDTDAKVMKLVRVTS